MMSDHLKHEAAYRGNINLLQQRSNKKLVVMGVGALGSFVTDLLARQGYDSITVVDRDKVERANFGTQNYGKSDIGRAKALQCAQNIMKRIGVNVTPMVKDVDDRNIRPIIKDADLVVDLFDNAVSRKHVKEACELLNIPCIHAGMASIGYFEVIWNESYRIPNGPSDNAPCDYPLASNLVMLCAASLAEVVNRYVDEKQKIQVDFWLSKMKMGVI